MVEPILFKLEAGETPDAAAVFEATRDPRLRGELYGMLVYHKKLDLFPKEFLTWESMTEGNLVYWLCHPNELGCAPDEIELMAKVPTAEDAGRFYFVYRFRMRPPHWCADDGWLAGVVGPYRLTAPPDPGSDCAFSRFEAYDAYSPEDHVARMLGLLVQKRSKKSPRGRDGTK
jgi:hypothetical protein